MACEPAARLTVHLYVLAMPQLDQLIAASPFLGTLTLIVSYYGVIPARHEIRRSGVSGHHSYSSPTTALGIPSTI
jgi:hypothetical protein